MPEDTISLTAMQRPDDDATDVERALLLADDLARLHPLGARQAQVYALTDVFDMDRDAITDKLGINESNYYTTRDDARDRVRDCKRVVTMLERHPAVRASEGKQVEDVRADEYDIHADEFATEYRHDEDDERVHEQFALDGENALVTVEQSTGHHTDEGVPGYILSMLYLDSGRHERRAVAASRLDELVDEETLRPAEAHVVLDDTDGED